MKVIICNCGSHILVDDEKFEELSKFEWHCDNGSVHRNERDKNGVIKHIVMANVISPLPISGTWMNDHIDRDDHNNVKSNLRVVTKSQNCMNQGIRSTNSSGYKGVKFHKGTGKWRAQIMKDGKSHSLGLFWKKEDAAQAYNNAAKDLFGQFAVLNTIIENKQEVLQSPIQPKQ